MPTFKKAIAVVVLATSSCAQPKPDVRARSSEVSIFDYDPPFVDDGTGGAEDQFETCKRELSFDACGKA